jgi:hypothetical protein
MKTHVLAKAYPLILRMARSNLVSSSFNVQQPMDLMYILFITVEAKLQYTRNLSYAIVETSNSSPQCADTVVTL